MEPIRVLQVVVNMNAGGIETMLMNIYRNIDRAKIQFDFLVHTNKKSFYEDEIIELGGKINRIIPLRIHNLMKYRKELNKFMEREQYRIVHSHISIWSYFVLKSAKKNKIPIRIAHAHEAHDSIWDHRLYRVPLIIILKKYLKKPLTHNFACGMDAGIWLFGKNSKFTVINNAIDASNFQYNVDKSLRNKNKLNASDKFVIGHVGRFNLQKNHIFLIDIFYDVYKMNPNSMLLLIGDGDLKPQIEQKVKELKIQHAVQFLGVQKDIPFYLQAMDVFLFPSIFEGLPVTLVEAQAAGLKIVASNKISDETKLTDLIEFVSLNKTAKEWAEIVLKYSNYKRENTKKLIVEKGYDITNNALALQNFYLKSNSNNE